MQKLRLSEYFINEFFPLNKKIDKTSFSKEFTSKFKSLNFQLSYSFNNSQLLIEAFTHKSFSHETSLGLEFNERLEFLGDAVLELVMTQKIFSLYPDAREGDLSKLRSTLVNEETLSHIARTFNFDSIILVGKGEIKSFGFEKASVLSDALEALIGAIYQDSNFETAKDFILNLFEVYEKKMKINLYSMDTINNSDPKSKLQEITMKEYKKIPMYESVDIKINKTNQFKVSLKLMDKTLASETNISKKKAMQNLAAKVLKEKLYKNIKTVEETKG